MSDINTTPEILKSTNKPRTARPNFSSEEWDRKIAEAEARIKTMRKQKLESDRDRDTRKKIIAGAGLFKAIKTDSDLRMMVIPAIQAALTEGDFAYAFGE